MSYTQEQQQQAAQFAADIQKALAPARLANTLENGVVLNAECERRGLPMTVESIVKIVNDILFDGRLQWDVEPEKLKARKAHTALQNKTNTKAEAADFVAKKAAAEKLDAQRKADVENLKQARAAVDSYHPVDRRTQKTAYGKQGTVRQYLHQYIDREAARPNIDTASVLSNVLKHISELYKADELAAERSA